MYSVMLKSDGVGFVKAITNSGSHLYICDSKNSMLHIYNAYMLTHIDAFNLVDDPYDIVVSETGDWYFINDQSDGVNRLYLYELDNDNQVWHADFNKQKIELVNDLLITLTGSNVDIYKLL